MSSGETDGGRTWYQIKTKSGFKPPTPLKCFRCEISVYQAEKMGPVNGDVVFHQACFNCCVCYTHLTMNNYRNNPNDSKDKEIYCAGHAPKIATTSAKRDSIVIAQAVGAQQSLKTHKQ